MQANAENGGQGSGSRWRIAVWGIGALILLLPAAAMQVSDEVNWGFGDFALAGALVIGTGIAFEMVMRTMGNSMYRAAAGVALAAAFALVWVSAGVGIIGKDGDPANLMYGGVLAVGLGGALLARLRPAGMARAMAATAVAQTVVAAIALIGRLGQPYSGPPEILGLTGFFVALWLLSAWLFGKAARG